MNKISIIDEIRFYKFIVKNGHKVTYESIKVEFGEPIWITVVSLKRDKRITEKMIDDVQYIKLTESGLKRYRNRHYLRILRFLKEKRSRITKYKMIIKYIIKYLVIPIIVIIIANFIYSNYLKN